MGHELLAAQGEKAQTKKGGYYRDAGGYYTLQHRVNYLAIGCKRP